jgi:prephenate dehydrogenase
VPAAGRRSPRRRASYRRIAIVGVGLVGGSFGLAARRRLPGARIVGVDRAPVLRQARRRGAIHEGASSLRVGLRGADLIVLALPVDRLLTILPAVARLAGPDAVVTDVGSTKEAIVRAARRAGLAERFVGGHPMAGSERSGVAHADARLFAGAPWILCAGGPRSPVRQMAAFAARLGARPVVLSPRRHDEVVARLSHLPQLLSVALVNVGTRGAAARALGLAGPAFRQMSRLALSPPRIWNGILRTNRKAIERALRDLARELAGLRSGLAREIGPAFRRAARARRRAERSWRAARRF